MRLAIFSPRRAFAESDDGKADIATVAALQEKRKREIEERNRALQVQEQALQRSLGVLNDDSKSQRTKELEKLRLDTQRFIEDAQAELLGVQRTSRTLSRSNSNRRSNRL
jgi:Skp family chaperone for outer membrane proteins